ncbi:uncharacterized protein LOC124166666 isoform X2 [Ischnura elegans]|uniref:uncharacterized protein LOC124166666 isoform X2 n=1 Tax=Ischnura elegans TaxID=197161 RepID=UPI001ED8B425|nr:uncharacterized protein LOC124166666 isoform X2 [Ischnura elegans]
MALQGTHEVVLLLALASLSVTCTALSAIESEDGTSVIPERFLPPRHFNHHPYTDVPLARYSKSDRQERERTNRLRGRGYRRNSLYNTGPVLFDPKPKDYAASRSYSTNKEENTPKKYMFHYVVHDAGGSGDDFSHAQAHDSGATTGEYRVRLPDGRLQVVRYTADRNGYKAKVMYHNEEEDQGLNHHVQGPVPQNHQLIAVSPYPTVPIESNQVYYTPQAEPQYAHTPENEYAYPGHQQQVIPSTGQPTYIYLYQDGRLTPIAI